METTNDELMGRMKVSRAVSKMVVPSVISSLVTVIYNMADTQSRIKPLWIRFCVLAGRWKKCRNVQID